jgi:hypothetical protein
MADLPDYVLDPNAVLGDDVAWRYKRAPSYTKTREYYEQSKIHLHAFPSPIVLFFFMPPRLTISPQQKQ